jgi:hypothetical protein
MPIKVCHYPHGTSKRNKIERRLFPFISMNWRGVPLTDYQTIVELIRNTKTGTGLSVSCLLDTNKYEPGVRISDKHMLEIKLLGCGFHKDWNYTLTSGTYYVVFNFGKALTEIASLDSVGQV